MPNILIRDLSQEAVDRIDAAAAGLGLSRNEYLRRKFEEGISAAGARSQSARAHPRCDQAPSPSPTWRASRPSLPTWRTRM